MYILLIYKTEISELINESKTFWVVEDVDPSNETGAKAFLIFIWKAIKMFVLTNFATGIAALIISARWHEVLPFVAWFPKNLTFGYEAELY